MLDQPTKVYSQGTVIGRYSLNEQSTQGVCCTFVYTSSSGFAEAGVIPILANNAHLLGQRPLLHAPMIVNHVFLRLL